MTLLFKDLRCELQHVGPSWSCRRQRIDRFEVRTSKRASSHIVAGKIVESWTEWDRIGVLGELGLLPTERE